MKRIIIFIVLFVFTLTYNKAISQIQRNEVSEKIVFLNCSESNEKTVILYQDNNYLISTSFEYLKNSIEEERKNSNYLWGDSVLLELINNELECNDTINAVSLAEMRHIQSSLHYRNLKLLEIGNCCITNLNSRTNVVQLKIEYYYIFCGYKCFERGRKIYVDKNLLFHEEDGAY